MCWPAGGQDAHYAYARTVGLREQHVCALNLTRKKKRSKGSNDHEYKPQTIYYQLMDSSRHQYKGSIIRTTMKKLGFWLRLTKSD